MYILGVTGNIGSGKSTVSNRFAELGAVVSHSDDLAKEILQNDPRILKQLAHRFGTDILDQSGHLQRAILAKKAFATKESQQFLNQLIHPRVRIVSLSLIKAARKKEKSLFVIDAPLLFEAGVDEICDSVLVIASDFPLRLSRVQKRSQIARDDFKRRDLLQLPIEEKISRADHLIRNNKGLKELSSEVDKLFQILISK